MDAAISLAMPFAMVVRDWIQNSYVTGGLINGPDCALPSGTLRGDVTFDDRIKRAVLAVPGLPVESVADEFASGLRRAWDQWFKSYSAVWPGAFPAFAAFPGPIAPPMPPVGPRPLALGASPGMLELTSSKLYNNLAPRIQRQVARLSSTTANPSGVDTAVRSLADWVDRSFRNWHVVAYFRAERIHGSGPGTDLRASLCPGGAGGGRHPSDVRRIGRAGRSAVRHVASRPVRGGGVMARILLINPPAPERLGSPLVGLQYVAASLLAAGHQVRAIDAAAKRFPHDAGWIVAEAECYEPDLVALPLYTTWVWHAYQLVERLRGRFPLLVAGGPHATACPEETLAQGFDVAVIGEGEEAIRQIATCVEGRMEWDQVPGIYYRDREGAIRHGAPRPPNGDLDRLPYPHTAAGLFERSWYGTGSSPAVSDGILASRGLSGAV